MEPTPDEIAAIEIANTATSAALARAELALQAIRARRGDGPADPVLLRVGALEHELEELRESD